MKRVVREITITISLPPKELSPNARPHRMAKAKRVKSYRYESYIETLSATQNCRDMKWSHVTVQIIYYNKTRHEPDRDNIISSLKSAMDGIGDGGLLIDDKDIYQLPVIRRYDKKNPRVEIILTKGKPKWL